MARIKKTVFISYRRTNAAWALADSEAYFGRLGKARELSTKATNAAVHADQKENGANWLEHEALQEAALGNSAEAKQRAAQGLKLFPDSQAVEVEAALAFAMAGDTAPAGALAQDLNAHFPANTQMQSLWLPAIRAQLALKRGKPAEALNDLREATGPIEWGAIAFSQNISCLFPTYFRGEAYLASGDGAAAAGEFQKILDHGGMVWNCWTGALARLGLARAYALSKDPAKAKTAYQDFLALWEDADPDVPILKQAKAEYSKLR
jgi:predicted Zn-dependent protease